MRKIGIVREVTDEFAVVEVSRQSACEGCHANTDGNCSACISFNKKAITSKAENSLGASVGDRVVVETESKTVLTYSAAVFLMPIIVAFIGYVIGAIISANAVVIGAIIGFIIACVVVFFVFERTASKRLDVKIVEILKN